MTAIQAITHARSIAKDLDRSMFIVKAGPGKFGIFDEPSTDWVARIYPGGREDILPEFSALIDTPQEGK